MGSPSMDLTSSCNWYNLRLFKDSQCQLFDIMGLLLVTVEIIVVMVPVSFIIFTIYKDFHQKHHLSSRNKILLGMSLSAISYIILIYMRVIEKILTSSQDSYINVVIFTLTQYNAIAYGWLSSCLSLFYFIKIVTFRSSCLSWMKMKIDSTMTWIVLVVEVLSLCNVLLALILSVFPEEPSMNSSNVFYTNNSDNVLITNKLLYVIFLSVLVPFLVMMVSTTFTMVSLKLHIRHLSRSMGPSGNAQLCVHHNVVRTLKHLLIFYILFVSVFSIIHVVDFAKVPLGYSFRLISTLLFIPVQTSIIIYGDPKLREMWVNVYAKCRRTLQSLLE